MKSTMKSTPRAKKANTSSPSASDNWLSTAERLALHREIEERARYESQVLRKLMQVAKH